MKKPSRLAFFSMPIGQKSFDGRVHDFDAIWKQLLRPAVPQGWQGLRIDEIAAPGPIAERYKQYLKDADVVVFDLTSANPNVFYELGVRDALAPGRRVLAAREGTELPFNIAGERVEFYSQDLQAALQSDFQARLQAQILAADGPGGRPEAPAESRLRAQLERATTLPALVAVWERWQRYDRMPADPLLLLAQAFSAEGRLDLAVRAAERAQREEPGEGDIARTLAWYLRRLRRFDEAADFFAKALAVNPRDVEAMGMLGGMYKRQALELHAQKRLDAAREFFERSKKNYLAAVEVDPLNIYNLVNVGALTFIAEGDPKAYGEVAKILDAGKDLQKVSTWDLLALAEAHLVRNELASAEKVYSLAARRKDFTIEMRDSATDQLVLLQSFGLAAAAVRPMRAILSGELARPSKAPVVLLHVSDVHFGKKPDAATGRAMHRFRDRGTLHSRKSLADHIMSECREYIAKECGGLPVRLVLVLSGDIAYQAVREEYTEAYAFVQELTRELGIDHRSVVIVPGNHDVNWKLSGHERSQRFDQFLMFIRDVYGRTLLASLYPHMNWNFDVGSQRPNAEEILSVHKLDDDGVVIIGFNSCVMEDDKQHFGAIGNAQLTLAEKALAGLDATWVRIAVMHHHVLPIESKLSIDGDGAEMDGTIVRDYALVERRLHALGFDMVLHGHKHEGGIRVSELVNAFDHDNRKSMLVCGAGSAGVEEVELPGSWGNHFAFYRIEEGRRRTGSPFVQVLWKELPKDDINTTWKTKGRWSIQG